MRPSSTFACTLPSPSAHLGKRKVVIPATARRAGRVLLAAASDAAARVLQVYLPRGRRVEALVRGVTAPQALYQHGGSWYLPVEVLLALLLLHLQGETGTEDALQIFFKL